MDPSKDLPAPSLSDARDGVGRRIVPATYRSLPRLYLLSLLFLAPVMAGFIWYNLRQAYQDTLAYWNVRLSSSADERMRVATLWLNERRTDTAAMARNPGIMRLLARGPTQSGLADARQGAEREIARMARINGFMGGAALDTTCQIAAVSGTPAESLAGIQETCRRLQRAGGFDATTWGAPPANVWFFLGAPVLAEPGASGQASRRELGTVIIIVEPWKNVLSPFMSSEFEPRQPTGSLIVWRQDNEAMIFNPRLGIKGPASVFRRPLSEATFESRAAREGKVDFGEFADYRGVRVLGAARPIAPVGASLIRTVDRNEALCEFHQRAALEWLAGALSVLLIGSLMTAQQRSLAARGLEEKLAQQQALLDLKQHVETSEKALRQSNQRYKDFITHSTEGVWRIEVEPPLPLDLSEEETLERFLRCGYPAECNLAQARNFGYSDPAEILNRPLGDLLPPRESDPDRIESLRSAIRGGFRTRTVEFKGLDREGGVRHLLRTEIPIIENGRLVRIWGITRDLTEHKRTEEALRKAEEDYRKIFEEALEGIYRSSPEGKCMAANPALAKMLGYRSAEELVACVTDSAHQVWLDPRQRQVFTRLLEEQGVVRGFECQYRRKDGSAIWVSVSSRKVAGAEGRTLYYEGFIEDITGRKRAHAQLQHSFDQLRSLAGRLENVREEERKRLAREIHDQLGQALTAVKLDLFGLIRESGGDPQHPSPRGASILQLVDETAQTVGRISTELRPRMLDDLGLVATLEWATEDFAARTEMKCRLDALPEDIDIDSEHATAIFRIVQETLTNVARHAAASEVEVRLTRDGNDLTLEVRDNGKGIDEAKLSDADSLGILGMRERAMALGGSLTITGISGKGTTVNVLIPDACRNTERAP
jgi:PAS domain S-box-containing protein